MDTFTKVVRDDGTVEFINDRYDEIVATAAEENAKVDLSTVYHPSPEELEADKLNTVYINRVRDYPSIGDQLDALFHAGVFPAEMAAQIQAVKDKYPKG